MSFLAILFALLMEQVRPLLLDNPVYESARSWARWCSRTLDAGAVPHGWLVWSAVVVLPSVLVLVLHWLLVWGLGWPGVLLAFILQAAVLYTTLGFRQFSHHFTTIREALDAGDEPAARAALAAWKRVDASDLPRSEIVRHVIEHSVLAAHRHVFAVLGWYALLAGFGLGPAGAVFYRMTEFARRYFAQHRLEQSKPLQYRGSESLMAAAQQAWFVVDYLPARLSALGFAVVGNFEDAIDSWRNFAQRLSQNAVGNDMNDNDGVILAATSGAINIRLGGEALKEVFSPNTTQDFQAIATGNVSQLDPPLSQAATTAGREPQSAHLRAVVGLVWRCVVLWMLLLALLSLARLLG